MHYFLTTSGRLHSAPMQGVRQRERATDSRSFRANRFGDCSQLHVQVWIHTFTCEVTPTGCRERGRHVAQSFRLGRMSQRDVTRTMIESCVRWANWPPFWVGRRRASSGCGAPCVSTRTTCLGTGSVSRGPFQSRRLSDSDSTRTEWLVRILLETSPPRTVGAPNTVHHRRITHQGEGDAGGSENPGLGRAGADGSKSGVQPVSTRVIPCHSVPTA